MRELAGDAELVAWLEEKGFTLEEAAKIQPTYEPACWSKAECIWGRNDRVVQPVTAVARARVIEKVQPAPMSILEIRGDAPDLAIDDQVLVNTAFEAVAGAEVLLAIRREFPKR